jgi:CHAT domain-containing protein
VVTFIRISNIGGKVFRQSDNPLFRSGLALAGANYAWLGKPIAGIEDGILTAYEVSNMYLSNTKLVVLSACETALGDIKGSEGVYGLQRAFKIAGVQNLVMSLWKVPDAETAEFMQLFYKNLFAKQTISQAFYNTQLVMKNKYRDDPYKWAAWVLVR